MQPGVTLITPTGDRPEAFALCERWMGRQTRPPDQWIVVDDGRVPMRCRLGQEHVRRNERDVPGGSLNRNLLHALSRVRFESVLIVEDDDWYDARYVEQMAGLLEQWELAGHGRTRYYNVRTRQWSACGNRRHASLCETGFRAGLIPEVERACRGGDPFVDTRLWRTECRKRVLPPAGLCVGIKGMPGRRGYGVGHRPNRGFRDDPGLRVLRKWIGADADVYAEFGAAYRRCRESLVSWWDWIGRQPVSPWVLLGKGPSFDTSHGFEPGTRTLGLNHVVRERFVDVAHVVDLEVVVHEVPAELWRENCGVLVMPWHPHVGHRAAAETLAGHAGEVPILEELASSGRLLCYHARTGERFRDRPLPEPVVGLRNFSGEAALNLLLAGGVRDVRTLGIDGGTDYADAFADLAPLANGRESFDSGRDEMQRIARRHGIELRPVT